MVEGPLRRNFVTKLVCKGVCLVRLFQLVCPYVLVISYVGMCVYLIRVKEAHVPDENTAVVTEG